MTHKIKAVLLLMFILHGASAEVAHAYETLLSTPHYILNRITQPDGKIIDEEVINGPPRPPAGYDIQRLSVALPQPNITAGVNILSEVPAFRWVFGCSSVSGAMIAGYYDRTGHPDMYTGPSNGGVIPLQEDATWPVWSDGYTTYPSNPLIASKNGLDGRATRGSIDDYWIQYNNGSNDPYITNGWVQHTWGDAIGDYMKTSQSAYGNTDGASSFYSNYDATRLTCNDMINAGSAIPGKTISEVDATYGRKLFYEARGYHVTDCYNQKTDNQIAGGFSFTQFKAEIDAGRPVLVNLTGHSVVGVGYDDSSNTIFIHDTWDNSAHTMIWGGTYSGMDLVSVSIVNMEGNLISIGQAVDNAFLTWTTGGDQDWGGQTATSFYGGSAAQSGGIGNSQTSHMEITVAGPATLTFYWKVSSEATYDYLNFYIDGTKQSGISGEVGWTQQQYAIPSGTHTLSWAYVKDYVVANGSDAGWVDKVVLDSANPLTSSAAFVQQQYLDFLNRPAEDAGLAAWQSALDTGVMTRAQVIDAFMASPEFGDLIAPVARLYFAYFLRIPDYDGLQYWIGQYRNNVPFDNISEAFAASQEFQNTYGSLDNSAFVTLIYQNVLGRAPDAAGLAYWVDELDSLRQTRGQVMAAFSESAEYKNLMANSIYVTMAYVGMLRRSPEQAGFDAWLNYLDQGNSGTALLQGFLDAAEYAARFL